MCEECVWENYFKEGYDVVEMIMVVFIKWNQFIRDFVEEKNKLMF